MRIIKVPAINGLGKTNGCRNAGNEIISELKNILTNEKGKSIPRSLNIEEIHVNNENLQEQQKLVSINSFEELSLYDKLIFIGGDHSISFPIVKSFLDLVIKSKQKPFLIVFDAHPDCMPPVKEPSHEEWLRAIVEAGFPKENILLIGTRNSDPKEIEFLQKNKIKTISLDQINNSQEDIADTITEFAQGPLYISFDIDVIDPAFAPSTGYPEPCGMTSRQALYLLSRLSLVKNLKAIDFVEINSENDQSRLTIKLAAKLISEFF